MGGSPETFYRTPLSRSPPERLLVHRTTSAQEAATGMQFAARVLGFTAEPTIAQQSTLARTITRVAGTAMIVAGIARERPAPAPEVHDHAVARAQEARITPRRWCTTKIPNARVFGDPRPTADASRPCSIC